MLRNAFVQVLQAKAVLQNARENLDYWDRELEVNRIRIQSGRHGPHGPESSRIAARAIRIGLRDRNCQTSHQQDPVAAVAQRSHADRTVRCDRRLRLLRSIACLGIFPDIGHVGPPGFESSSRNRWTWPISIIGLPLQMASTDPTFSFDFARNPPIPGLLGIQRQHSVAHLRSESGRKSPDPDRYRPQ